MVVYHYVLFVLQKWQIIKNPNQWTKRRSQLADSADSAYVYVYPYVTAFRRGRSVPVFMILKYWIWNNVAYIRFQICLEEKRGRELSAKE